jgi:hypothetical protein
MSDTAPVTLDVQDSTLGQASNNNTEENDRG